MNGKNSGDHTEIFAAKWSPRWAGARPGFQIRFAIFVCAFSIMRPYGNRAPNSHSAIFPFDF